MEHIFGAIEQTKTTAEKKSLSGCVKNAKLCCYNYKLDSIELCGDVHGGDGVPTPQPTTVGALLAGLFSRCFDNFFFDRRNSASKQMSSVGAMSSSHTRPARVGCPCWLVNIFIRAD